MGPVPNHCRTACSGANSTANDLGSLRTSCQLRAGQMYSADTTTPRTVAVCQPVPVNTETVSPVVSPKVWAACFSTRTPALSPAVR